MKIYSESGKYLGETDLSITPNVKYVEIPAIIDKCLTMIALKVSTMRTPFTQKSETVLICNDEFKDYLQLTR